MRLAGVVSIWCVTGLLAGCAGSPTENSAPSLGEAATAEPWKVEPSTADPARADGSIEVDGRGRTYVVHVPADLDVVSGPVPLVLAFHGGLGSGEQFQRNSRLDAVADELGFVVVYPDGVGGAVGNEERRTWNAGYCCGPAAEEQVDDVAFVDALLDELESAYVIDTSRVYAMGHSNGGMMSYRLACELSERIVAVGLVGGSLGIDDCEPSEPVSVMHVHGTADQNHPIDGGVGTRSLAQVEFRSARDSVEQLAQADECSSSPIMTSDGDLMMSDWSGCGGGAAVRLVAIEGADHPWPGGTGGASPLAGPTYEDYDASTEIARFLLQQRR